MASVTHSEFGADTEGVEVVKAFASNVRGKTVLVTGGNRNGLGYSAAQAIVSLTTLLRYDLQLILCRHHKNQRT